MKATPFSFINHAISRGGLLALVALIYLPLWPVMLAYTRDYPGVADGSWRSLSVQAFAFLNYWWSEGALSSRFALSFYPSHEFAAYGMYYHSYSPLFVLPLHLFALARGSALAFQEVLYFSMALHFFTGLLVALLVHDLAKKFSGAWAFVLALLSAAYFYYVPGTRNWLPHVWWPDVVGFSAFLFLLYYEFFLPRRPRLEVAFFALVALLDWLPFIGVLVLGSKRLLAREKGASKTMAGLTVAGGVFMALIFFSGFGAITALIEKVRVRLSVTAVPAHETPNMLGWWSLFTDVYGKSGMVFYILGLAVCGVCVYFFTKKRESLHEYPRFVYSFFTPIFLHNVILWQHYASHPYNTVRFSLLVPVLALLLPWWRKRMAWVAGVVIAGALALSYPLHQSFMNTQIDMPEADAELCSQLRLHVKKNHVFFAFGDEESIGSHWLQERCDFRFFWATEAAQVVAQSAEIQAMNPGRGDIGYRLFSPRALSTPERATLKARLAAELKKGFLYEIYPANALK